MRVILGLRTKWSFGNKRPYKKMRGSFLSLFRNLAIVAWNGAGGIPNVFAERVSKRFRRCVRPNRRNCLTSRKDVRKTAEGFRREGCSLKHNFRRERSLSISGCSTAAIECLRSSQSSLKRFSYVSYFNHRPYSFNCHFIRRKCYSPVVASVSGYSDSLEGE